METRDCLEIRIYMAAFVIILAVIAILAASTSIVLLGIQRDVSQIQFILNGAYEEGN